MEPSYTLEQGGLVAPWSGPENYKKYGSMKIYPAQVKESDLALTYTKEALTKIRILIRFDGKIYEHGVGTKVILHKRPGKESFATIQGAPTYSPSITALVNEKLATIATSKKSRRHRKMNRKTRKH